MLDDSVVHQSAADAEKQEVRREPGIDEPAAGRGHCRRTGSAQDTDEADAARTCEREPQHSVQYRDEQNAATNTHEGAKKTGQHPCEQGKQFEAVHPANRTSL